MTTLQAAQDAVRAMDEAVRNRVRPLTSEWLQMRTMLERANLEREDVLARAWKWQAAIAVTAFLVGGLLGRAL